MGTTEDKKDDRLDNPDLLTMLRRHANHPGTKMDILQSILNQIQEGDSAALRLLERALEEPEIKEDYLDISDDIFQKIIVLAAARISGTTEFKKES